MSETRREIKRGKNVPLSTHRSESLSFLEFISRYQKPVLQQKKCLNRKKNDLNKSKFTFLRNFDSFFMRPKTKHPSGSNWLQLDPTFGDITRADFHNDLKRSRLYIEFKRPTQDALKYKRALKCHLSASSMAVLEMFGLIKVTLRLCLGLLKVSL